MDNVGAGMFALVLQLYEWNKLQLECAWCSVEHQPPGENPARQAFLSGPWSLADFAKI